MVKKADLLRYLEARFAFEPLPHYAMIAVELCGDEEPLPQWVREFLSKLAADFFEGREKDEGPPKARGTFPSFSFNSPKPKEQWDRAADCILFLTDQRAALEKQQARLRLVQEVERRRTKRQTLETIFPDLQDEGWGDASRLRYRWRSIVAPRGQMGGLYPIALQADGEIVFWPVQTPTKRGP